MRKRRIRDSKSPSQNLDSFLDILTNTVGVLMFTALFISLLTLETGTVIRTPLKTNTKKIGKYFEIRNNQVFYLSDDKIDQQIKSLFSQLPECIRPKIPTEIESFMYDYYLQKTGEYKECQQKRYEKVQSFSMNTDYYNIRFVNGEALKYEPLPNIKGDDKKELKNPNSDFQNVLNSLDSEINYVAFIVRDDSFSTFRVARKFAWDKGFDVGWEPFNKTSSLIFGSGGRSIGVQ